MWSELEAIQRISGVDLSLAGDWPAWLALVALGGGAAFAVLVYRGQRSRGASGSVTLMLLRGAALAWLGVLLLQPTVALNADVRSRRVVAVLVDRSSSMSTADLRSKPGDAREAAVALGLVDAEETPVGLSSRVRQQVEGTTRFGIAEALLEGRGHDWFAQVAASHPIAGYAFGRSLTPVEGAERTPRSMTGVEPNDPATALGAAIEGVLARHADEPLAGIVLLTDGGSNEGPKLHDVARRAAGQGVPLFPVAIGVADPPDVAIERVSAREVVFVGDRLHVQSRIRATGFDGMKATLRARLDGVVVAERPIELGDGAADHAVRFNVQEQQLGPRSLEVEIEPLDGEATTANNRLRQTVRVIDQQIRVLYVERSPRWQYRYLKRVLDGDRRIDARYRLMSGDSALADTSRRFLSGLAENAADLRRFDVVILGDVAAGALSIDQMRWLEELVRHRGGAMLVLAGDRHAPSAYRATPLEPMMPIRLPEADAPPERVGGAVHPVLTRAGADDRVMRLHPDGSVNAAIWAAVHPIHRLPRLAGPRRAATVLLTLSDEDRRLVRYPLIARQRFGAGWSMYVGSDALWRMRRAGGPGYHTRFWRQAVRALSMTRLLYGGQRITIETDRRSYQSSASVNIRVAAFDDAWAPVQRDRFVVEIEGGEATRSPTPVPESPPTTASGDEAVTRLALEPAHGQPGVYRGVYRPPSSGHYAVRAMKAAPRDANVVTFDVHPIDLESRRPGMQRTPLKQLATLTGGGMLRPSQIGRLPRLLAATRQTERRVYEMSMWDTPASFVLLIVLLGGEWFIRRRRELV